MVRSTQQKSVFIHDKLQTRELEIGADIRRKGKVEKTIDFVKRIKRIQKKVVIVMKRAQEEMKRQADKRRKKAKVWKKRDK